MRVHADEAVATDRHAQGSRGTLDCAAHLLAEASLIHSTAVRPGALSHRILRVITRHCNSIQRS
jgi:hypothetical protein